MVSKRLFRNEVDDKVWFWKSQSFWLLFTAKAENPPHVVCHFLSYFLSYKLCDADIMKPSKLPSKPNSKA